MSLFRNLLIDKKRRRFYCEVEFITFGEGQYIIYNGEHFPSQPSTIYKYETLIPVLDWSGVPCMYDRVTEQLFYNQGMGSFVAGRQIHPVDYLESTGTQYIDTGIQTTDDYGYKIRNTYTRGGGEQCAIGCMDAGNRFVGVYTSGAENQLSGAWGSFVGFLPTFAWTTGDILDVEVNYKNSRKMIVNGTELKDISDVHISGTISNTLYLFARHYGGTITKMVGNVYGIEITNGQNIVADYIPAIDSDGVGFMFDRVSHTIYDNAGTGAFKYPAREVEYLESDGESFLDTQYVVQPEDILTFGSNSIYGGGGSIDGAISYTTKRLHGFNTTAHVYVGNTNYTVGSGLWDVNSIWKVDLKNGILHYGSHSVEMTGNYTSLPNVSFCFMARHNNMSGDTYDNLKAGSRFTFFKVTRNGSLIRDFIPCYKDGVAGMWDKANNVFYPNAGTGQFLTGKIIESEYE